MRVIVVKSIMACSGSGVLLWGGCVEEFADLGPGEFLVSGVMNRLGQELAGLGDQAGEGVQPGGGVAEPVGGAQPGEVIDGLVEDLEAVVAGDGRRQLAGPGQAQGRAVHEASWSTRASSEANSCWRCSWLWAAAWSCWAARAGRNSMLVWK
jgi:hypothetical protein